MHYKYVGESIMVKYIIGFSLQMAIETSLKHLLRYFIVAFIVSEQLLALMW